MDDLANDLLDGVPEIAAFTGWTERRVYYLAHGAAPVCALPDVQLGFLEVDAPPTPLQRALGAKTI
jgi:hypothetical protein